MASQTLGRLLKLYLRGLSGNANKGNSLNSPYCKSMALAQVLWSIPARTSRITDKKSVYLAFWVSLSFNISTISLAVIGPRTGMLSPSP